MHRTTPRFWTLLSNLPQSIQELARANFALLKANPTDPSLHFKKMGVLWSVRVGINYRAAAVQDGGDFIWVCIGPHDEYERLIKSQR